MSASARRSVVRVLVLEIARLLAILGAPKRDGLRFSSGRVRASEEEVPTAPAVR